jgi:hypothetical protein
MYYLKCNNCGHLNEVKSEYLIFCTQCDKKLENNFTDWLKRNQESTFEDFKKLICVSEQDIRQSVAEPKPKSRKLKYWIGFAVTFAIFYAIGQFGGESIVKLIKSGKTAKEVLGQKWIKETYGDFGLTVETPIKLIKGDLPVPENVRQVIDKMDVYEYKSVKGFKILINSIKYNPSIGVANLEGAATGSINEMKLHKGVTDFSYSEEVIFKNEIPGFIQTGSYKLDGVDVAFINTGFSKGLIFWWVQVAYLMDDEVGRTAAKRVIESIEIKGNNTL